MLGYDDTWDNDYDWAQDDNVSSSSQARVLLVDPPDGIGRHTAIQVGEYVFLTTSKTKRRGESGYIEIPEGEGGLNKTSFVNLNNRFAYNSCTTLHEIGQLSVEMGGEISNELKRLYPDIELENLSTDEDQAASSSSWRATRSQFP